MGSAFDEMTERSHPEARGAAPRQRNVDAAAAAGARVVARRAGAGGFRGIDNEWWHFEMLDRQHLRQHFVRVD
jgi:D-alanyl-D-alanine dipeptidase